MLECHEETNLDVSFKNSAFESVCVYMCVCYSSGSVCETVAKNNSVQGEPPQHLERHKSCGSRHRP